MQVGWGAHQPSLSGGQWASGHTVPTHCPELKPDAVFLLPIMSFSIRSRSTFLSAGLQQHGDIVHCNGAGERRNPVRRDYPSSALLGDAVCGNAPQFARSTPGGWVPWRGWGANSCSGVGDGVGLRVWSGGGCLSCVPHQQILSSSPCWPIFTPGCPCTPQPQPHLLADVCPVRCIPAHAAPEPGTRLPNPSFPAPVVQAQAC